MEATERLSAKISKFRPSVTLGLKLLVDERQSQGLGVYDFGLGETKGTLNPAIVEAGKRAFREEQTMYTHPAGLAELREAVLDWLGLRDRYGIDSVLISTGAKQSLFNIFLAVCNPGDAVLLDAAPWVSYQALAVAAYGFPVMVLPLDKQREYLKITVDDLQRNLDARPHAKLFLLNNPCNPTGQLYGPEEVEALLALCVERRIYFVLDRLYWRIVFDGRAYPEPRIDDETRAWLIQVDGMSKNFRRTGGLRIGWAVGPTDLIEAMVNLQSHYTSGPATPTQQAALAAITRPYGYSITREMQANRDLLWRESRDMPHVTIWPTAGTFYSFWDIQGCFGKTTPDGEVIHNSDDLARYLVRSEGVVTASGAGFMQDGYLRLSFAAPEQTIVDGMAAARRALSTLQD